MAERLREYLRASRGSIGRTQQAVSQRDLYAVLREFDLVGKEMLKEFSANERKKILRRAARPVRKAARNKIKDSARPHARYNTPKVSNKLRAPKGMGRIAAIYNPGNLRRSIKILSFKQSSAIFVGPQRSRKKAPEYGKPGQPTDGYYAQMVYGSAQAFGRRITELALSQTRSQVIAIIAEQARKKAKAVERKNAV